MIKNFSFLSLMFLYINILGYVFHFTVSRSLGPEKYGEFMVLYSLMLSVSFLSSVYPTLTIKEVLENEIKKYEVLRFLRLMALVAGLFAFLVGIFLSSFFKSFLNVSDLSSFFIVSLVWFFIFLISTEKGFLQSQNRFGLYSLINSLELSLRLVFALILVSLNFGVNGALASTLISVSLISVLLFYINKNIFGKVEIITIKKIIKSFLLISPTGIFIYADDIFIKRVFDSYTAGLFASVSILGKAIIWLCITLFSVFFVKIAKDKENYKSYLIKSILLVIFIIISSSLFSYLFGKEVFSILFGDKFLEASEFLPYYILSIFPLLINLLIFSTNVAIEKFIVLIYLYLISYYLGFVVLKFNNVYEYMSYIFIFHFITLIINLYLFLKKD